VYCIMVAGQIYHCLLPHDQALVILLVRAEFLLHNVCNLALFLCC